MWKKLRRAQVLTFRASARPNEYDYLFSFNYILFINVSLHLIGEKTTFLLIAVIFKRIKFDINQVFFRLFRSISSRHGVSHETEANRANLCLVVDCFRGEIHQSREARPPG